MALDIHGFRGIKTCRVTFTEHAVLVGASGVGKSTIIDALSLVLGRERLVRNLTEHDFWGGSPNPADRLRIVATLGFPTNDPDHYPQWIRHGRAVPKWWNPSTQAADPFPTIPNAQLCIQLGYVARFDHHTLEVERLRYFHDDDALSDPFIEDTVVPVPSGLLNEIGFFVLPARRMREATVSFNSELFRLALATAAGIPAESILRLRDFLRNPDSPLESDPGLAPFVERINARMANLFPGQPKLRLRLTATDSDSVLDAIVAHYEQHGNIPLPAGRHGAGLVSLQALVLLLEIGRARKERQESFIMAIEEPELHIPPGLQRRIIGEATAIADQVICTTHSPRVAAFFQPHEVHLVHKTPVSGSAELPSSYNVEVRCLVPAPVVNEPNAIVQLYTDDRTRLIEALMFPTVLVPEGRTDANWLRLLVDVVETARHSGRGLTISVPPFAAMVGVVPTRNSAVSVTFAKVRALHDKVFVLVDGDETGNEYIRYLCKVDPAPFAIVQWPDGWGMERVVGWILDADPPRLLTSVGERLGRTFGSITDLLSVLRNDEGRAGGLKSHYMAHEEIASVIRASELAVARAELVLEALARVAAGITEDFPHLTLDSDRSRTTVPVYRFRP